MPFLNKARWVTDKYILVMLGLFPLVTGLEGYDNITASKFGFFAAATALWLLVVLVFLAGGLLTGERYSLDVRPAHLAVGVFLAVGGVSACLSEYGSVCLMGAGRYDGYLTSVLYGVIFFGVSLLGGKPRRRYAWALGFSALICCAVAALQLLGFDPFRLYPDGTNYYDKYTAYNAAFLGTIGNVGLLAAYLCVAAPLLTVFSVLSRHRRDRLLLIPAVLSLGILAGCDVDAGVVALAGAAVITVPMVIRKDRPAKTAAIVSAALTLAGLGALYFWPGKSGTLFEMRQVLHGRLDDSFGSSRGQIWKQGWALVKEHPWLGAGPGTAASRFDIQWYSEVRNQTVAVTNAHNVYLGHLMNTGILGLLGYLGIIGCSAVTWFRRRRQGAMYPALGAAILCCLIQDFFGLGLSLTVPVLWVVWGLLETRTE